MRLAPAPEETIGGAGHLLRAGELSCVDLVQQCLKCVDAREPDVKAWVHLDRAGAVARAEELDDALRSGRWLGPLHGIPLGIKDIVDVAGMPTAAGSGLWAGRMAEADAPIVAALRAAGAIILGKTVTTAYAWIDPPPTRNPWNLERTPGGSSSGSAAAVASGMCLGAIGSQTGGSITRPASFCGVAGLKPTHGALSLQGILEFAPSLDHPGPIARTVDDMALIWQALGGSVSEATPKPPRLGRVRGLFEDRASPEMRQAVDHAVQRLLTAGATVHAPALPASFADVLAHHRTIMAAEAAAGHEARFLEHPEDYPPRISELIREGMSISAVNYIHSRRHQNQLKQEILDCFQAAQVLLTPATTGPAPDPSTTGDPALNAPWSYTGLPTVSFPIALAVDGLPLAIQLVGRPGAEADLLAVGQWCENAIK